MDVAATGAGPAEPPSARGAELGKIRNARSRKWPNCSFAPIAGVFYMQPGEDKQHALVKHGPWERGGEDLHNLIVRAAAANEFSGQLLDEFRADEGWRYG